MVVTTDALMCLAWKRRQRSSERISWEEDSSAAARHFFAGEMVRSPMTMKPSDFSTLQAALATTATQATGGEQRKNRSLLFFLLAPLALYYVNRQVAVSQARSKVNKVARWGSVDSVLIRAALHTVLELASAVCGCAMF